MGEPEPDGLGVIPAVPGASADESWALQARGSDPIVADLGRPRSRVRVHLQSSALPGAPDRRTAVAEHPRSRRVHQGRPTFDGLVGSDELARQALDAHEASEGPPGDELDDRTRQIAGLHVRERAGVEALAMDLLGLLVACVTAAVMVAMLHVHRVGSGGGASFGGQLLRLLVCIPVFAVVLTRSRSPLAARLGTNLGHEMGQVVGPTAAGGLASLVMWQFLHEAGISEPSVDAVLLTCLCAVATVGLCRSLHHAPPGRGGRRARRVVVVGTGMVAGWVAERLAASSGAVVVGFVDDDPVDPARWLGPLRQLSTVCHDHQVDHVVVAFSRASAEHIVEALRPMQGRLPISVVPRLFDLVPASATVSDLGSGLPAVSVAPATLGWWPLMVKRSMDIVGAGSVLVLLSPLLAAVAVAVRISSPGPVILRQVRIGRDGRPFTMYKFRTMRTEGDPCRRGDGPPDVAVGPFHKLKRDPRVTAAGRLLRRTSIDELPQLVNVLAGQMSLVGPRPFIPEDSACIEGWAARRYTVKPGLTGLWQVSGRNDITFEEMCRLDHLYSACWSVGLDARILLRTLRVVMSGRGAY